MPSMLCALDPWQLQARDRLGLSILPSRFNRLLTLTSAPTSVSEAMVHQTLIAVRGAAILGSHPRKLNIEAQFATGGLSVPLPLEQGSRECEALPCGCSVTSPLPLSVLSQQSQAFKNQKTFTCESLARGLFIIYSIIKRSREGAQ